jgi:hypothetical protein
MNQAWQRPQLADSYRLCPLHAPAQVTDQCDPFCGRQGGPLLNTRHQAIYGNGKNYIAYDALGHCRKGLLVAVSELQPLDNAIRHASRQKPPPWALSAGNTVLVHIDNRDTNLKVCYTKFSASAAGLNNLTGLPGDCPQLGLATARLTAPEAKPSGPTSAPKLPARAQWKLADTCEDEPATCAVLTPKVPVLLAPRMPDIYPGNFNTIVSGGPCPWQLRFLDGQVGEGLWLAGQR